jgi:hypothetical protein
MLDKGRNLEDRLGQVRTGDASLGHVSSVYSRFGLVIAGMARLGQVRSC